MMNFRNKLAEQEERLGELEKDMQRIRDSDGSVNADLDELDAEKRRLEDKLENLQAQKQNITKASPVGKTARLMFLFCQMLFLNVF